MRSMPTILPQILEDAFEFKEMKLTLDRMRVFDAALGFPSCGFKSVHVAGTNGKGSVSTKIASALPGKVGLFTSPHLESYRERIQINGEWISEEASERLLAHIIDKVDERPTYFEILTLLAFTYFAENHVDVAVIEVGVGGRLDATNIVTPILSVITSIDLDHTHYLGETLEEIAREKGGIIKPGVPAVVGPHARYYPNCIEVSGTFTHYEEENQAIAREALKVLGVENPDVSAVPPCRFEQIGDVIFDVAHNPAGLERTFERISLNYPGRAVRALVAFSSDKDREKCLEVVERHTRAHHFVKVDHPRLEIPNHAISFEEALGFAQKDELILICGSFFIMGDAKAIVKRVQPFD